jgi:hypothetical protein
MANVATEGAYEGYFDIVQKSENHETDFSVPVGSPYRIGSVQNEPHVLQIDIALPQVFVPFRGIKTEVPDVVE